MSSSSASRTPPRRTTARPPPTPIKVHPSSPTTPTTPPKETGTSSSSTVPTVNSPLRTISPEAQRQAKPLSRSLPSSKPGSPPIADRPKTRARDLLRQHYGLGVGAPPPLKGPGRSMDPLDMDSPAFDAKSYFEQLITVTSLPSLLRKENELISEIRELDSERQSLVYNHHHDLIAASDTIAAMRSRAENLDADLEKLKSAFSEISRLASEVITGEVTDAASADPYTLTTMNENIARASSEILR